MIFNLTINDFVLNEEIIESKIIFSDQEFIEKQKLLGNYIENNNNILKTYSTEININDSLTRIYFDPNNINNIETFIQAINKKLVWISKNLEIIKINISKKLLKIKNDFWLNENENNLTITDFIIRLKRIDNIVFNSDNSFNINFNDDYLFDGHSITVPITNNLKIADPKIEG